MDSIFPLARRNGLKTGAAAYYCMLGMEKSEKIAAPAIAGIYAGG
jgi:hypothetical protein